MGLQGRNRYVRARKLQGRRVEATSNKAPTMMRRRVHLGEREILTSLTCAHARTTALKRGRNCAKISGEKSLLKLTWYGGVKIEGETKRWMGGRSAFVILQKSGALGIGFISLVYREGYIIFEGQARRKDQGVQF